MNLDQGNNATNITNCTAGDFLQINSGTGNDSISMVKVESRTNVVQVQAGDGDNTISITSATGGFGISVLTGNGVDKVTLNRSSGGQVNIETGDGADDVSLALVSAKTLLRVHLDAAGDKLNISAQFRGHGRSRWRRHRQADQRRQPLRRRNRHRLLTANGFPAANSTAPKSDIIARGLPAGILTVINCNDGSDIHGFFSDSGTNSIITGVIDHFDHHTDRRPPLPRSAILKTMLPDDQPMVDKADISSS